MKLHFAGVVGVMMVALSSMATVGCGAFGSGKGAQAKVPVGTTTLTNAPMTPDAPLPPAIWEEEEEHFAPPVETWGVRPATEEELAKYGF